MPKLDLKVKNRQIKFLKNQLLRGDNAKLCRGGVNHDPKVVVGVVDDLKKKFSPIFLSKPPVPQSSHVFSITKHIWSIVDPVHAKFDIVFT